MSNVVLSLAVAAGAVVAMPLLAVLLLARESRRGALLAEDARVFGLGEQPAGGRARPDDGNHGARRAASTLSLAERKADVDG